jgi:hypothetical protein
MKDNIMKKIFKNFLCPKMNKYGRIWNTEKSGASIQLSINKKIRE